MKKKMQKSLGLVAVLAAAAMILSACGAAAPAEPTVDPNVIFTQVAETVMVSMTQTSEAIPPTATPEPSATPEPTQPPMPTDDLTMSTADATGQQQPQAGVPTISMGPTATVQLYGDVAKWNTQSPLDGKVFSTNKEFNFHVCMGNVGSTNWTTKYYMHYVDGYNLCDNSKTYVGETVEPGEKWCFDLNCTAPSSSGPYTTYWFLKNGDGKKVTNGEIYFTYKVD